MRVICVLSALIIVSLFLVQCTADDDDLVDNTNTVNNPPNPPNNGGGNNGGGNNNGNGNNNGGNNNGGNNGNLVDDRALPLQSIDPSDNIAFPQKVELGRMLFWDPILSGGKDVACVTCHHPNFGYADGRDLSIGVGGIGLGPNRRDNSNGAFGIVPRNAPTIINTAFNGIDENGDVVPEAAPMFWDLRVRSLEQQALRPTESFVEMRGHAYSEDIAVDSIVQRLRQITGYQTLFRNVFGNTNNAINDETIAQAIAAFERSIIANDSPFDRFARGDNNAMTQQQMNGMQRFNQAGCDDCHNGPMFSDYELHVLAVPENNQLDAPDRGADNTFAFRTPTLRNLNVTGPFFHNGVANSLNDVVNFYRRISGGNNNNAGNLNPNPNVNRNQIDNDARNLNLNNNDVQAITAFLGALNDDNFDRTIPNSVPSGLPVGGRIQN
ncbi:MAG: cytochrome-c peroxidase [Chitinophagales bacterium]